MAICQNGTQESPYIVFFNKLSLVHVKNEKIFSEAKQT